MRKSLRSTVRIIVNNSRTFDYKIKKIITLNPTTTGSTFFKTSFSISNASLNKNSFNEVDFVYKYYNQIVEFILK